MAEGMRQEKGEFPIPLSEEKKIRGVTSGAMLTLDAHPRKLLSGAQTRQWISNKVARTRWGLETAALQITHQAAIGSLLRYALGPAGSLIPADLLRKIEVNEANVAARIATGLFSTDRAESLHMLADAQS